MQIAERLCDQILAGEYAEASRVPSVREVAAQLEVNPNTVVRSFDYLQNSGIIFNKRGMGYFVAQGAIEEIRIMRKNIFMQETLPQLFAEMNKIGLTMADISEQYNKYNNEITNKTK